MSTGKRKVNPLTIEEKRAVILEVERADGRTKSQIAEQFQIPKSTLSTLLKERDRIFNGSAGRSSGSGASPFSQQKKRVRTRRGAYPDIEQGLLSWMRQERTSGRTVSTQGMTAKSQELGRILGIHEFKCSNGWMDNFRRRHGIVQAPDAGWMVGGNPAGQSGSGQMADDNLVAVDALARLSSLLAELPPQDVFIVAETGLVFDLTPADLDDPTAVTSRHWDASRRFSVLAAASVDGSTKLPLLVVGADPLPGPISEPCPIVYQQTSDCYLRPHHFASWLKTADRQLQAAGRRAIVLCEYHPLHCESSRLESLELICIPEGGGCHATIDEMRKAFRTAILQWLAENGRRPMGAEALELLSIAWWKVLKPAQIRRRHEEAGLLQAETSKGHLDLSVHSSGSRVSWEKLSGTILAPPAGLSMDSYIASDRGVKWWTSKQLGLNVLPADIQLSGRSSDYTTSPASADRFSSTRSEGPTPPARSSSNHEMRQLSVGQTSPASNNGYTIGEVHDASDSISSTASPSTGKALEAINLLISFFKAQPENQEVDDILNFVAFTKEKIICIHTIENKTKNGAADVNRKDDIRLGRSVSPTAGMDSSLEESVIQQQSSNPLVTLTSRRGVIRVGPQFQAAIPSWPETTPSASDSPPTSSADAVQPDHVAVPLCKREHEPEPSDVRILGSGSSDRSDDVAGAPDMSEDGGDEQSSSKSSASVDNDDGEVAGPSDSKEQLLLLREQTKPDTLLWTPGYRLADSQVHQFITLARAVGMLARACDGAASISHAGLHAAAANASRDITRAHALHLLHRHEYRIPAALAALVPEEGPVLCRDELEDWSASEAAIFEEALSSHGKRFNLIRDDYLPWKTRSQIIEFYYMWKTTGRYVRRRRAKLIRQHGSSAASKLCTDGVTSHVTADGMTSQISTGGVTSHVNTERSHVDIGDGLTPHVNIGGDMTSHANMGGGVTSLVSGRGVTSQWTGCGDVPEFPSVSAQLNGVTSELGSISITAQPAAGEEASCSARISIEPAPAAVEEAGGREGSALDLTIGLRLSAECSVIPVASGTTHSPV